MGLVYHGIHKKLALRLQHEHHIKFFVETGTSVGTTAIWAANHFDMVYTIELNKRIYARTKERHGDIPNIRFFQGDSATVLPSILVELSDVALFWLDAHWSADLAYKRPAIGECPLMGELAAIVADAKPHVVLIDDARQFTGRPPQPHLQEQWPTIDQITNVLSNYHIAIKDDVVVATRE